MLVLLAKKSVWLFRMYLRGMVYVFAFAFIAENPPSLPLYPTQLDGLSYLCITPQLPLSSSKSPIVIGSAVPEISPTDRNTIHCDITLQWSYLLT